MYVHVHVYSSDSTCRCTYKYVNVCSCTCTCILQLFYMYMYVHVHVCILPSTPPKLNMSCILFVRHFKRYINIVAEFIPQILFLLCIFGWLVILIISKWIIFYEDLNTVSEVYIYTHVYMYMYMYTCIHVCHLIFKKVYFLTK